MDLAERFEGKVDRSGEHHLWTGSRDRNGIGQVRVDGKLTTARRVAWELARGPLRPGIRILACPDDPACVRVDHLSIIGGSTQAATPPRRGRKGGGSMRELRPGVWELSVRVGRSDDGRPIRTYRTVRADTQAEASRLLTSMVAESNSRSAPVDIELRSLIMDEAVERFLTQHLKEEKGWEERTLRDYRGIHKCWFSPVIGRRRVSRVDTAAMDQIFGRMRAAGLSRSRLNQAKSLYQPFFRWAKRRGIVTRDPMAGFELPTSRQVTRQRTPPEVGELTLLLGQAVEVVPDVAPVLVLGAVSGMRRGELVAVRRSRIDWKRSTVSVDSATDLGGKVKGTKTRRERTVHLDAATMAMLARHCDQMDQRARAAEVDLDPDPYLFSRALDCSTPVQPDRLTKQVAVLKAHLGIEDKSPEVIDREEAALAMFRQPHKPRPAGRTGPAPKGGVAYAEIAEHFGRSERWAMLAVRSALRREEARKRFGGPFDFDGSILALRKFTSSELLDAGFNLSMVAQRQGHGPQVLAKHYAKSRPSADRKAAEHLGRVVHGSASGE